MAIPAFLFIVKFLFSGRGYNIESLTVAPGLDTEFSRITIVTQGDEQVLEQITKQLNRLIPTLKVMDLTTEDALEAELIFCKITARDDSRSEILRIAEIFNAKVVDVSSKTYTLQFVGDERQVKSIIELLRPLGIKELVRSGKVAISRESQFQTLKNM